mgnify:CR=1 FL=1
MVVDLLPKLAAIGVRGEPSRHVADVADADAASRAGILTTEERNERLTGETLDEPLAARNLLSPGDDHRQ